MVTRVSQIIEHCPEKPVETGKLIYQAPALAIFKVEVTEGQNTGPSFDGFNSDS